MSKSADVLDMKPQDNNRPAAHIDPEDMGCGQRCFFTYGQMCQRAGELFGCCLTDYEETMQKERRWEETVRLKERVLKQRDHLVKLERGQKQLMEKMTAFQTDTTQLIEETGEDVRKELKKAFRMEVDISTKELMRRHEQLSREQHGMGEVIGDHEKALEDLSTRTDKIKRDLNETFVQLQEVDEELKTHEENTAQKFTESEEAMATEQERVNSEFISVKEENSRSQLQVEAEGNTNSEQNFDLVRIKKALEALRQEQLSAKREKEDKTLLHKIKRRVMVEMDSESSEYSIDEDGTQKLDDDGKYIKRPKKPRPKTEYGGVGGIAGKMKAFIGRDEADDETDLQTEEDEPERPPYWEHMIHTPDEEETPSEFELRLDRNEALVREKIAEEKMEKRRLKKRAKKKKLAEREKDLKKKNTKVAATGGGGASLPAHVTNG